MPDMQTGAVFIFAEKYANRPLPQMQKILSGKVSGIYLLPKFFYPFIQV